MMTSKQRAKLRKIAHDMKANLMVGKEGLSNKMVSEVDETLNLKEVVKIKVLKNAEKKPAKFAETLSEKLKCEVVSVTGYSIILYRFSNLEDIAHIL